MLTLRRIGLDTFHEHVAVLSRHCTVYRADEFRALRKIEIHNGTRQFLASLMIADDPALLGPDELGLSIGSFDRFGLAEGAAVTIAPAAPPASLDAVRDKIRGRTLSAEAIRGIVADIAAHRYSAMEIAAFLISSAAFLTMEEVLSLTRAMAAVGNRLDWNEPLIVDKHCIGGIPGNRTSMIVVPIVAAHGLPMPKTSSRAITSPAGTADAMEVMARVDLSTAEMRRVVERERGCLVWGGHVNLSPADDILISVERPLGVDTREQMVASILSKKMAAGSTHLLIDIPVGPTAKVRTPEDAVRVRKLFEYVGDRVGLTVEVVITDGTQPIGRGIGPLLEARDALAVLRNDPDAPADLREKSLFLAGRILDFDPALRGGAGAERARAILNDGKALAAFERIITAQGRRDVLPEPGSLIREVPAPTAGRIAAIDCLHVARIARLAGAPFDPGAGIDLLCKVGDRIAAGQPLYRIHACKDADFRFAVRAAEPDCGYRIESVE